MVHQKHAPREVKFAQISAVIQNSDSSLHKYWRGLVLIKRGVGNGGVRRLLNFAHYIYLYVYVHVCIFIYIHS